MEAWLATASLAAGWKLGARIDGGEARDDMPETCDHSDDDMDESPHASDDDMGGDSSMEADAEVEAEETGRKRAAERAGYDAAVVKRGLRLLLTHERLFGVRLGAEKAVGRLSETDGVSRMEMESTLYRAAKKMYTLVGTTAREAYIETYTLATKGGAQAAEARTLFSPTESKLLVAACNLAGRGGFFLSTNTLRDMMVNILKADGREGDRCYREKDEATLSDSFIRKWIKNNNVKRYRNSGLDSKRAEKATETLRDKWFQLIVECAVLAHDARCPSPLRRLENARL